MEFTSQICTTQEQSERLMVLGLKRETADMTLQTALNVCYTIPFQEAVEYFENRHLPPHPTIIPAWSLHRLLCLLPSKIRVCDRFASLIVSNEKVQYYLHDVEYSDDLKGVCRWKSGNIYDNIIDCIRWLIGAGYFNKEYLVE